MVQIWSFWVGWRSKFGPFWRILEPALSSGGNLARSRKNLQVERVGFTVEAFSVSVGGVNTSRVNWKGPKDLWQRAGRPFWWSLADQVPVATVLAGTGWWILK